MFSLVVQHPAMIQDKMTFNLCILLLVALKTL